MCWGAGGTVGGGVSGGLRCRNGGRSGGVAGVQQRDVLRRPPPVGAAAAVVSNTDHAALFFFFFLNVRFLRPAAPSGNLEEGGAGFRRRGRRAAVAEGVWRSLFCLFFFGKSDSDKRESSRRLN